MVKHLYTYYMFRKRRKYYDKYDASHRERPAAFLSMRVSEGLQLLHSCEEVEGGPSETVLKVVTQDVDGCGCPCDGVCVCSIFSGLPLAGCSAALCILRRRVHGKAGAKFLLGSNHF